MHVSFLQIDQPLLSFICGGFITMKAINPLERKLTKRTSVHWQHSLTMMTDIVIVWKVCMRIKYPLCSSSHPRQHGHGVEETKVEQSLDLGPWLLIHLRFWKEQRQLRETLQTRIWFIRKSWHTMPATLETNKRSLVLVCWNVWKKPNCLNLNVETYLFKCYNYWHLISNS